MAETYDTAEVRLDSDDEQFTRGAQIGVLYGVLAAKPDLSVSYILGRDNVENVLRVADALHRPFKTIDECSQGCHLVFVFEAAKLVES